MDETKTNLPATTKKRALQNNDDNSKYFKMPNSPASNTMLNVVGHAGNLETFANRLEQNSHSSQLEFFTPPEGTSKNLSERVNIQPTTQKQQFILITLTFLPRPTSRSKRF